MQALILLFKIAVVLLGVILVLGGGVCAVIDITLLPQSGKGIGSAGTILFFTVVSLLVGLAGGLMIRAVLRGKAGKRDEAADKLKHDA